MILNIKGIDYRCYVLYMSKSDAIKLLNNSVLDNTGVLQWISNITPIEVIKKGAFAGIYLFILMSMINGIKTHGKNLIC